jgi:hypothetical protein
MINSNLLVFDNSLQDFFVDKCGNPLSGGTLTFYVDDSRTTLKNAFYQANTPAPYTYIPLPNPLTLSAAGSIADTSGHDVLIGWYPVMESDNLTPQLYYVTMYNACGELEWTRSGFPYNAGNGLTPAIENDINIENYVINNRLWRNNALTPINATTLGSGIGGTWTTQYNNTGTVFYVPIAPGSHDGFSMPDINFIKNINGATDTITVLPFANSATEIFTNDIAGEYYINFACTSIQSGENIKCFQYPISLHNETLCGVPFTFTIQAQSISGTNTISASIYQFTGTGNVSPSPALIGTLPNIELNSSWQKFMITGVLPITAGNPTVNTFDDGLYLQINMPMASAGITNLNFALPSIYLSTTDIPTNDFQTYDQIGAIIDSSRTGDIRTSLNNFYPFGWVPMNDGTIGNPVSGATNRANTDTWPLYNLIWNAVSQTYAAVTGGRGATALADFIGAKPMALTAALGQVFAGTATGSVALGTTSGTNTLALTGANLPVGTPFNASGITGNALVIGGGAGTNTNVPANASNGYTNGSGTAFNNMQATTYMNVFIKL